jgi:segregation and condensation protein B
VLSPIEADAAAATLLAAAAADRRTAEAAPSHVGPAAETAPSEAGIDADTGEGSSPTVAEAVAARPMIPADIAADVLLRAAAADARRASEPAADGAASGEQTSLLRHEPVQDELVATGDLKRNLEALLFVASESLSIKKLAKLTSADEALVSQTIAELEAEYADRGIGIRLVAEGYRFATSPAAREAVEAYLMPPKTNLSPAAMETLAIVAYLQPATKGDVEAVRGVNVDGVVQTLVDRRFIAEAGRKEVAGRPILYKTTPEFLEAFGLASLEELPPVDLDALEQPQQLMIGTMTNPAENLGAPDGVDITTATVPVPDMPPDDPGPEPYPDQPADPQPMQDPPLPDAQPMIEPTYDPGQPQASVEAE